jgi:hypothetical protein
LQIFLVRRPLYDIVVIRAIGKGHGHRGVAKLLFRV